MIEILSHKALQTLIGQIKDGDFVTVIIDKSADIRVRDQVSVCFCFVTETWSLRNILPDFSYPI